MKIQFHQQSPIAAFNVKQILLGICAPTIESYDFVNHKFHVYFFKCLM
jgi:hypothetical protein